MWILKNIYLIVRGLGINWDSGSQPGSWDLKEVKSMNRFRMTNVFACFFYVNIG